MRWWRTNRTSRGEHRRLAGCLLNGMDTWVSGEGREGLPICLRVKERRQGLMGKNVHPLIQDGKQQTNSLEL